MAYRVLIANESGFDCCALGDLLTSVGYDTTTVQTFEDARGVLNDGPPDLLIAHLRLGAFNGLHLVLRGRADRPDMSAIITTGPEDQSIRSEAMELGVLCVTTPVMEDQFLETVRKVIEGRGSPAWH
jgi:DNA-binding NtrC family response regulator